MWFGKEFVYKPGQIVGNMVFKIFYRLRRLSFIEYEHKIQGNKYTTTFEAFRVTKEKGVSSLVANSEAVDNMKTEEKKELDWLQKFGFYRRKDSELSQEELDLRRDIERQSVNEAFGQK